MDPVETEEMCKDRGAFAYAVISVRGRLHIANLEISKPGTDTVQRYGPQPASSTEEARMWIVSRAKHHGFSRNDIVFDYEV